MSDAKDTATGVAEAKGSRPAARQRCANAGSKSYMLNPADPRNRAPVIVMGSAANGTSVCPGVAGVPPPPEATSVFVPSTVALAPTPPGVGAASAPEATTIAAATATVALAPSVADAIDAEVRAMMAGAAPLIAMDESV